MVLKKHLGLEEVFSVGSALLSLFSQTLQQSRGFGSDFRFGDRPATAGGDGAAAGTPGAAGGAGAFAAPAEDGDDDLYD